MLTSSEKKDWILRMIAEIRRMVDAMMGKDAGGGTPEELLARAHDALGRLLGPMAGIVPRMDSATAAQMVGDPDVVAAWAELAAAEAEVHRQSGDAAAAHAASVRALELAIEAHLRSPADRPDVLALIDRLRPSVDAAHLSPRHADALASLSR
jgi:HPt (histidine-containing phosphotransfer) domain-containing protein